MMIKTEDAAIAHKEMAELLESSNRVRILSCIGGRKFGKADCGKIGRSKLKIFKNATDGEPRHVARFLQASEFCFFDRGEDGVIVKQRRSGIAAELGKAEDAHQ